MFNFLVTATKGAWEQIGYEYPVGRFLEYTSGDIAARFKKLGRAQIKALKELPCLFAYEGTHQPMRVGRLGKISLRSNGSVLYVEPEIDQNIRPIPFEEIEPLKTALDIRNWELNRTHWAIKDEDLFGALVKAGIVNRGPQGPGLAMGELPVASRPDFRADAVGTFIDRVLRLDHGGREVFYRGHSNRSKFQLAPSLLRKDEMGNFIHLGAEGRMYRELLISNSIDFQGDTCTFDRLVRMQHYSLPTRLLDITSNPLIALYFACNDHPDDEGEVIVFSIEPEQIKYFDSDTASCIANLTRLSQKPNEPIDYGITKVEAFNQQDPIKRLLHFVREEKPYFEDKLDPSDLQSVICVKGKRTNSRIAFQSGAFLLFGDGGTLPEKGTPQIKIQRIGITNKPDILKQLDQLNINESTVFPYIENSAKYIAGKFKFKGP